MNPETKTPLDADNQPSAADLGFNVLRTGQTSVPTKKPSNPDLAGGSYKRLSRKNIIKLAGIVGGLALVALIGFGGIFGLNYYRNQSKIADSISSQTINKPETKVTNELDLLGDPTRILVVNSAAEFNGNVKVAKDLTLGGKLATTGPLSVNSLRVTGASVFADLTASTSRFSGQSNLLGGANVGGFLNVSGSVNVTGNGSFTGDITANSLNVKSFSSGNLSIGGHLITTGAKPTLTIGPAAGANASAEVVGNDSSGTITINTGPFNLGTGVLVTLTFRNAFGAYPKVLLTPTGNSGNSSKLNYYTDRSPTNFSIKYPVGGSGLAANTQYIFDYLVVQ